MNTITDLCDRATVEGLGWLTLVAWLKPTIAELMEHTRRDRTTISRKLGELESRGLLQRGRDGHADRFYLSAEAEQLPLPELSRIATVGEGSSSSLVVIEGTSQKTTTTTQTVVNHDSCKPVRHPAEADLVQFLIADLDCPSRRIATEAIKAALEEGLEPIEIKYEALWWWLYWASGDGKGIDNIGIFIARKIQGGECVRDGYRYDERKARAECSRLVDLFLEIEHLYDLKINDTEEEHHATN